MDAFTRAAGRFAGFFRELNGVFLEREDVLTQTALALLSREHVLLTGPPGTAKSQLARAVLGRILDATTGQPSLFARQFTENTVLTDLVGALDFKTLMETGRSEHFTDEGIIGSVHAFLDEVFDGRDMLLRSTLNLLGERELKQGARTTRGRIECSLMTSNRYLTEVLDESREALLAFVDRIAFVGFVPKGFSSAEPMRRVMRQNVVGSSSRLRAYLSIQDIDSLQELVEQVRFPEAASDRLVVFLDSFEAEMQAAVRAIPDFTPSRYLSIRTRVRAGKILKAVVAYRKIFEDVERPLAVELSDFRYLRFVLLQSGPPPALLDQLAQEQDAREARQLKIIKTERDVFERSLARLDPSSWRVEPSPTTRFDEASLAHQSVSELVGLLEHASDEAFVDAAQVKLLSQHIMRQLIEHGLSVSRGGGDERVALRHFADRLEGLRGPVDALTQWLRARSLTLLESAVQQQVLVVEGLGEQRRSSLEMLQRLGDVLEQMQAFRSEADELRARQPRWSDARLDSLLLAVAGAVTNRLRETLHREVTAALADTGASAVSHLKPVLAAFDDFEARARVAHPAFGELLGGLSTSLLWPVMAQALAPLAEAPRAEYLGTFDRIWTELSSAQLARHAPLEKLLGVALERAVAHDVTVLGRLKLPEHGGFSAASYSDFRNSQPRASLGYLCVQLCLRVDSGSILEFAGSPELATFSRRLATLPATLRDSLWRLDTQRVALALAFFEGWLSQASAEKEAKGDAFRLLGVLSREEALSRLRLETELTEALFPESAAECQRLRGALEALFPALGRATTLGATTG
jgi:MoxR-like ATPase